MFTRGDGKQLLGLGVLIGAGSWLGQDYVRFGGYTLTLFYAGIALGVVMVGVGLVVLLRR